MGVRFDLFTFHLLLDAERRRRGMKWKEVSKATGVVASSLTRLGQGKMLTIHALGKLSWWARLPLDDFLVKEN